MGTPTISDPLGDRPNPASFADMMESLVDARIDQRWRGRATNRFDDVLTSDIILELLARGWAVYHPDPKKLKP